VSNHIIVYIDTNFSVIFLLCAKSQINFWSSVK